MKKTVIVFTILSIVSKLIAFARELVLSYFYGAGQVSDIFLLSMTLPVTIFGFIATGVTSGFIPVYQQVCNEKGKIRANKFTNHVISFLLLFCVCVIVLYYLFSEASLRLFASGFDHVALMKAKEFTNITIWAVVSTSIVTVFSGYLQINDRIRITAMASMPLNVGVIISILLSYGMSNTVYLPVGFLIASATQVFFLGAYCIREGYKIGFGIDFNDKYVKAFLSGLFLLVVSGSLQQVNLLIDRTLATTVLVGGLSIYEYGTRINDFIMGLTIIPISTAIFPLMAKVSDNARELGHTLHEGIRLSSFILIPIMLITIVYSDVIVTIIYQRGAFGSNEAKMTSEVVRYYGIGLLAFSLRDMILKCFYAKGNVKSPVVNASIGILINVVMNFILLKYLGIGGLALATSISAIISVILLYRSLRHELSDVDIKQVMKRMIGLFILAGVGCGLSYMLFLGIKELFYSQLFPFAISCLMFAAIYMLTAYAMKIVNREDLTSLIGRS